MWFNKKLKEKRLINKTEFIPIRVEFELHRCCSLMNEYAASFPEREKDVQDIVKKLFELAYKSQKLVNSDETLPGIHISGK